MLTYQDLLSIRDTEKDRMNFVLRVINEHKDSQLYKTAKTADLYRAQKNPTIMEYKRMLYKVTGQAVPDATSANYKITSNYFNRFITQEVQFLLGNGITWQNDATKDIMQGFDNQVQTAGKLALSGGVSFGFWNYDRLDVFPVTEFAPLWDEQDGALKAGVRFWQIAKDKPMRATLYEMDGYTEYMWQNGNGEVLRDKRGYIENVVETTADGERIYDYTNYPTFPVVPLWANDLHQSELVGMRDNIDAYDLIKSGFCNTVDEASMIYWTINNAGGMDDIDLAKFVDRMRTIHATTVDADGAMAESHTVEAPYASREALLDRIEKDLYKDAMALNVDTIASGATTATQIRASYEPLNSKTDEFEYQVTEWILAILHIAGIDDMPTYTRSMMLNVREEVETVIESAPYLSPEYVTEKILTLLGDGDKADEVLNGVITEAMGVEEQRADETGKGNNTDI